MKLLLDTMMPDEIGEFLGGHEEIHAVDLPPYLPQLIASIGEAAAKAFIRSLRLTFAKPTLAELILMAVRKFPF